VQTYVVLEAPSGPHAILRPGLTVELAPGVPLRVGEVHLPAEVLGIEGEGLARQMLPAVGSLRRGAKPSRASAPRGT